jgi:hypothetical protein
MAQVIVIPFDGQEIGQGFNSDTRESIGTGLIVDNVSEDPSADGQTVSTQFESIATQDDLMEALGMSTSVDARYALFSGGAKVSFAESHAVNSFSSYVAGRCQVQNAIRHGHGFHLTPEAQALLTAERMDEFRTAFGDMFVRSLKTGGEFYVVARITSVSEDHQETLAASLNGAYNGLVTSVEFQANFNKAMQETSNRTEVTVWMNQAGGLGQQNSFTGPDAVKILDRLSQFPQSAHDHAAGYETELAAYDTIPIPIPTLEERDDRNLVLSDCANQKMGFLKALADLELAIGDNGNVLFENLPSRDALGAMEAAYRTALSALMAHAIKVSTGEMDPPQMFVANPIPPAINFTKKAFSVAPTLLPVPNLIGTFNFGLGTDETIVGGPDLSKFTFQQTIHEVTSLPPGIASHMITDQDPTAGTIVPVGSTVRVDVTILQ